MKMTNLGMLCGLLLSSSTFINMAIAQSPALIAREACNLGSQAKKLSVEIEATMHGSIFEQRLFNNAAEFYQTAERIERVAERNGNVRQMEADAKLLNIILERTDCALTEAETFAIRNPHHGSGRCHTQLVRNQVAYMCQGVANLRGDLESLCRMGNRPQIDQDVYRSNFNQPVYNQGNTIQTQRWQASRPIYDADDFRPAPDQSLNNWQQQGNWQQPGTWQQQGNWQQPGTWQQRNYGSYNYQPGIKLGNSGFSIQLGR